MRGHVRPCLAIPLSAALASCGGSGHTKGYHYGAIGSSAATICLKAQRPVSVFDRRSWQRSVTGAILKPEVPRRAWRGGGTRRAARSEEQQCELKSIMRRSYAVSTSKTKKL